LQTVIDAETECEEIIGKAKALAELEAAKRKKAETETEATNPATSTMAKEDKIGKREEAVFSISDTPPTKTAAKRPREEA
ncbi:hypothetical protein KC219_27595, partial [Mycobacterium tuberculosis]|nr:hypothetical protein [Mycobacterium tuberculosis]